jgi:putative endonuclease
MEHRSHFRRCFTERYDITRLVYFECGSDIRAAIARERQIKGWSRAKKLALIASQNPDFRDLAADWLGANL